MQKDAIRRVVEALHSQLDVPYSITPYDQRLHDLYCGRAIEQGYPMGTDPVVPTLRPFLPATDVVIAATAYAHLDKEATCVILTMFAVPLDGLYKYDSRAVQVGVHRPLCARREAGGTTNGRFYLRSFCRRSRMISVHSLQALCSWAC